MRNTEDTIAWYREHEVFPGSLSFDPDGMCLRICREARGLPAKYPSAVAAQEATPESYRVHRVADLKRGMVIYYDDPRDSNPFGHIVTMVGRVEGADPNSLSDILVRTNSVRSNRIVVVRGDYFQRHWGDEFQFGATWLNGFKLDLRVKPDKPAKEPKPLKQATNLRNAIKDLEKAVDWHTERGNTRLVKALQRDIAHIQQTIKDFK